VAIIFSPVRHFCSFLINCSDYGNPAAKSSTKGQAIGFPGNTLRMGSGLPSRLVYNPKR
jgi:hypothetical protein